MFENIQKINDAMYAIHSALRAEGYLSEQIVCEGCSRSQTVKELWVSPGTNGIRCGTIVVRPETLNPNGLISRAIGEILPRYCPDVDYEKSNTPIIIEGTAFVYEKVREANPNQTDVWEIESMFGVNVDTHDFDNYFFAVEVPRPNVVAGINRVSSAYNELFGRYSEEMFEHTCSCPCSSSKCELDL